MIRIVDGLDGSRGPGPAWTIGHLAFLGAMAFFVAVFVQLRRMAGRNALATVTTVVAIAGAVALSGQFAVDVVAGFMADDHLGMSQIIAEIRKTPGLSLAVYDVGPYLFYLGQLGLVVQLAATRVISVWTPLLVLFDLITPFIDKDLIPLGALVLMISFAAIAKRIPNPTGTASTTVPALL
ncbi:hypothetical protein [Amycolatopsis regifaucium]|uniref:hypothetical protein n=1 Tax=Amycolatopsis regifaucium TaxID=546365 RepID=UPI001ABFF7DF|nr:hypothetical protein [Amycolatopsis regifaucium]